MPSRIDLHRQNFGRLIVISKAAAISGRTAWLCECDCGAFKIVKTQLLTLGKTKSCGCIHKEQLIKRNQKGGAELAGKRFGRLLVIKKAGTSVSGTMWECVCNCGKTVKVSSGRLISGNTESCGCLRRETLVAKHEKANNLIGFRFGKLTVLERAEIKEQQRFWKCKCDCGSLTLASTGQLKNGKRTNCGCTSIIKLVDLTGKRFFRLSVIELYKKDRHGQYLWRCLCECGKEHFATSHGLLGGNTKSCGCWKKDQTSLRFKKHGKSGTKEYSVIISAKRRAVKRNSGGSFSVFDIEELFKIQKGVCIYCRVDLRASGFHRDHIIPLVRGGTNYISNIQLLCPKCNMKKHEKNHEEYLSEISKNESPDYKSWQFFI